MASSLASSLKIVSLFVKPKSFSWCKTRRCFCSKSLPPRRTSDHKPVPNRHPAPSTCQNQSGRFSWYTQYAPQFLIRGEQVQIISEPTEFYEILKLKTRKAKKRVTYASLYLGNGSLERELVSCMREACLAAVASGNSDFEVNILLDYTRGSRGAHNSRSMLRPLMAEFSHVRVSLYHTPDLRGLLKKIIPERFNETIGLTHVKVYLFDDSFIISGANLSKDYFVNRQDRYILFNDCAELANFFNDLVQAIMSFSLTLNIDNTLQLASDWNIHPYTDNSDSFKMAAREKISKCLRIGETIDDTKKWRQKSMEGSLGLDQTNVSALPDTAVYPLVQMGPFGVTHDERAMLALLHQSQGQDHILLASGYFNLTDHYMKVILEESKAKFSVLMASPKANGFLGAKGVAGAIPYSYIFLAHQFHNRMEKLKQMERIHLMEYERDNWTFHGKGLWYYLPNQSLPTLTLVGSPNFGYRSVYRDLECQVAMITNSTSLREQLRQEHVHMYSSSSPVTESSFVRHDRHVATWIKLVTNIIKHFF